MRTCCHPCVPSRCALELISLLLAVCTWSAVAESQETPTAKDAQHEAPWAIIRADDATLCTIEGRHSVWVYPRSVGRQNVALFEGSKLSITTDARAIYLRLPIAFASPGPRYSDFAAARLRVRIDDRPCQEIALATARQEWPVADDLPLGEHHIIIEPIGPMAAIDGFRVAPEPLSGLLGHVVAAGYSELLTDVRIDVDAATKRVRTEYVRSPLTGNFEIWGLAPGSYTLHIAAAGWLPLDIADVVIRNPGERVDLGIITLTRDPRCGGGDIQSSVGPRFGRSLSVAPGQSFRTLINLVGGTARSAQLVSPFKTIDVPITDIQPLELGTATDVGAATFQVPSSTPHDMYDLGLSFSTDRGNQTLVLPQAVCVREPLPPDFFVAGIGHMNTWGQQTAEYLARVAEVTELAGARTLLISNEVNAAYVAGALQSLRIPYLVTPGNHTMPRWHEFFGASSVVHDDGALRVVTFGGWPYESWNEAARLIKERSEATNRVLLCYEGYAPIDVIRDTQVDLLFDGHSDREHPDRQLFPAGTLHMRAPTQETIRWIPMTHEGLSPAVRSVADVATLDVPRLGPAPLRVKFSASNDGSSSEQTAVITNEYALRFPRARIRCILRAGEYRIEGGRLLQSFEADDGAATIIDVEVDVTAQAEVAIAVRPE